MKTKGIIIGAAVVLIAGVSWAGSSKCDSLDKGSIARIECDHVQKVENTAKSPANDAANLGTYPSGGIFVNVQSPFEFLGDPLRFVNQEVSIRPVFLKKFISNRVAVFEINDDKEILITDIPSGQGMIPGHGYAVVVIPRGVVTAENAYGGPVTVPAARFVSAVWIY